jgi:hypothetical protein
MNPETVALSAAIRLHTELLQSEGFLGYEGTKAQFDALYQELSVIALDEVSLEIEPLEQVIETFYQYQFEIAEGERSVDWYL